MAFLEEVFTKNEVLKSYPRFQGSGGDKDYLEVYADKDIKVGVKFALESGHSGTMVLCRVRIVSSNTKDIFNVCQYAEEKYGEGLKTLKEFGQLQCSGERASVCMVGSFPLESLGNDLAVDGAKIIKGFNTLWRDVTKRASHALKIITFGDKASLDHMLKISHALNSVYCPDLPPARDKADVVDIKSGNGNGKHKVQKAKPKPKAKAKAKKEEPKPKFAQPADEK